MAKKLLGPTTQLYPMPALLIAVKTGEGTANILTIAWGGIVGGEPPLLALCIGSDHHSSPYLAREGSFTVNVPRSTQAAQADYCGIVSGSEDPDKATSCGWTLLPSKHIASPIIAECPLNLECRIVRQIDDDTAYFCLAEILETHVDEAALNAKGQPDARLLDPLVFTPDGQYLGLGEVKGKAFSIGKTLKKG